MNNPIPVTERDLRKPEYRDGAPEDYEFDADNIPVRKDRWESTVRSLVFMFWGRRGSFTCQEVLQEAARIKAKAEKGGPE